MMSRLGHLAVGDIHGSAAQLQELLRQRVLHSDRRVVFLGDYVDIGPDSKLVVDLLLDLRSSRPDVVFLKGNHDVAFLNYLHKGDFEPYAAMGGIPTIRSYCGEVDGNIHQLMVDSVPVDHRRFMSDLVVCLETPEYLFSHAGYRPEDPTDRSVEAMAMESHQALLHGSGRLDKLAICGHYVQRSHVPLIRPGLICMDTGCAIVDGPLSAVLLPELRIIQIWPDLRISESPLPVGGPGRVADRSM